MSEITHAHIIYKDSKEYCTVPICDVKLKKNAENNIEPTSESDFEKRKYYYVKWSDCGEDCEEDHLHFGYYPAFILFLGVSVEDIENKVAEGRRRVIPNGVQSSESEENVKPTRNQKHHTLMQDVQNKKNIDILNRHKSKTLLSSRKRFTSDLDHDDQELEEDNQVQDENQTNGEDDAREANENDQDIANTTDLTAFKKELRQNLQQNITEVHKSPEVIEFANHNKTKEHHDKISMNVDDAGCSASSHEYGRNSKPAITSFDKVELDWNQVYKSSTGISNRNKPKGTRNPTPYEAQKTREGDSNDTNGKKRKMKEIPHTNISCQKKNDRPGCSSSEVVEGHGGNVDRVDIENASLHNDANEMIEDDDNDNPGGAGGEQIGKKRLPLQNKKRRSEPTGTGRKGNTSREIEEMIQYYHDRREDPNVREMYKVTGTKIYLGEDVEASAALWFLIQQKKPTIFFRDMIELIWPQHSLLNRCLSKDKITTRLLNRSPMKELTPRKKRLAYKLYSDYLDSKRINETEKMKFLSKVPALTTAKIQYLRSKYYE